MTPDPEYTSSLEPPGTSIETENFADAPETFSNAPSTTEQSAVELDADDTFGSALTPTEGSDAHEGDLSRVHSPLPEDALPSPVPYPSPSTPWSGSAQAPRESPFTSFTVPQTPEASETSATLPVRPSNLPSLPFIPRNPYIMATGVQAMPVRGERTCPKYDENDPRCLARYFDDLEALFDKHSVPNDAATQAARKTFAVRYLPRVIEASWRTIDEFRDATKTYGQFKTAVFGFYPGASATPEFTIEDLQDLVDKRVATGPVRDLNEYSNFYMELRPVAIYLLDQNRINHIEANKALARALGPAHRDAVKARLQTDVPNRSANTPYTFAQFHKAATYVLQHRNDDFDDIWDGSRATKGGPAPLATPAPVRATPVADTGISIKQEDAAVFANLLSKQFASALSSVLPKASGSNVTFPDRSNARTPPATFGGPRREFPPRSATPRRDCFYCGNEGCETKRCPEAKDDIDAGKIKRENGLLVMFDGSPIPYQIKANTLREKVNIYLDQQRKPAEPAEHMFLELFTPDDPEYVLVERPESGLSPDDGAALEAFAVQVNELAATDPNRRPKNLQFDGVEIIQRPRQSTGSRPAARPRTPPPANSPRQPSVVPRPPTPGPAGPRHPSAVPPKAPAAVSEPPSSSALPLHPYATAKDATDSSKLSSKPVDPLRGVAGVQNAPVYRSESVAENPAVIHRVLQKVFKDSPTTLTTEELIAISAPLRKYLHNLTAVKRVPVDRTGPQPVPPGSKFPKPPVPSDQATAGGSVYWEAVPDQDDPLPAIGDDEDADEVVKSLAENYAVALPGGVVSASARGRVRALMCMVNDSEIVECLLDGGSQIVAISEECCHRLHIPFDPENGIPIQSANGAVNPTIGVAHNVSVTLPGELTVYLQMYVVRNAPYDILLGRPFETLVKATIENVSDDEQTIKMHCPNTGAVVKVATRARKPRSVKASAKPAPAAGFQA